MTNYPKDTHFAQAVEAQFRIGEMYLNGKKIKFLGLSVANALDKAVEIFAGIVRSAAYGKYTARAQFDIGLAREKQGANDAALLAYEAVVDKFPNEPVAVDAQYQIGYIWFTAARQGTKDYAASEKARIAFQDFLFRYPSSEKAAQARANLDQLQHKQTSSSFRIAQFYDKQKYYRAAVIYYNEVIRQQPGSAESEQAKKRIDELKAKVGEAALQPLKDDKKTAKGAAAAAASQQNPPKTKADAGDSDSLPPSDSGSSSSSSLMPDAGSAAAPQSGSPDNTGTQDPSASPAP
jgi:outer membrane protein assembly factor BamD